MSHETDEDLFGDLHPYHPFRTVVGGVRKIPVPRLGAQPCASKGNRALAIDIIREIYSGLSHRTGMDTMEDLVQIIEVELATAEFRGARSVATCSITNDQVGAIASFCHEIQAIAQARETRNGGTILCDEASRKILRQLPRRRVSEPTREH
jgi:hypothetical protein